MDNESREIWNSLRRTEGPLTKREKIERVERYADYCRKRIAEKFPICCAFWQGMYVQKDVRHIVQRVTKMTKGYSQRLVYCPECGKRLNEA